ncbi:hypothetical protein AXF42_Ash007522 [Apostasia shenzhenica]|uniref:VWFA domain-containing protein n=1 Tax=Apostasia shenzhenica TaxID=1088818 RepID=A0A2I0A5P8_9ASPA|nr:hypothetical protein AXF42_Ash007522 [Apostasia shenzhenica]
MALPAAVGLLGPPEIWHGAPAADADSAAGDRPLMGFTENLSPTFLSSGDPLLDFFFHVVPDTPAQTLTSLLADAWERDPLTAFKLVFNLRGVRGTGKSDREGFYSAALWIHRHHPKTLALNLPSIAEFGYFKDLPEILHRLIDGADTRQRAAAAVRYCRIRLLARSGGRRRRLFAVRSNSEKSDLSNIKKKVKKGTREERLAAEFARVKLESANAADQRRKKRVVMAVRAVDRYGHDPDYHFLHDRVSDHFAAMLSADVGHLNAGEIGKISLAAKWCPSLNSCFDRSTLLCEGISRRLFPRESDPELAGAEEAHYAYRIRDRLRREVLVPLRRVLEIPEVYMSARQWSSLPYSRVPSVAMKNYKQIFTEHDMERFAEFLEKVKQGKAKIAAGALLPHEILAPAFSGIDDEVAELQWRRMVQDLSAKGHLRNCIAVCDVSGSMRGTPMEVCIALGMLTSELSEEPWKGRVITFSRTPELHKINGETIKEKIDFVRNMQWGMNTNFQKVFDGILREAVEESLPAEKMVRRIFVFSDMEFDSAGGSCWETDYEVICRKFKEAGYAAAVPEIVFWNLRDSRATPVPGKKAGVALVSGFSKNLMKIFLEDDGVISPVAIMEAAISGEEYGKLEVFD